MKRGAIHVFRFFQLVLFSFWSNQRPLASLQLLFCYNYGIFTVLPRPLIGKSFALLKPHYRKVKRKAKKQKAIDFSRGFAQYYIQAKG